MENPKLMLEIAGAATLIGAAIGTIYVIIKTKLETRVEDQWQERKNQKNELTKTEQIILTAKSIMPAQLSSKIEQLCSEDQELKSEEKYSVLARTIRRENFNYLTYGEMFEKILTDYAAKMKESTRSYSFFSKLPKQN